MSDARAKASVEEHQKHIHALVETSVNSFHAHNNQLNEQHQLALSNHDLLNQAVAYNLRLVSNQVAVTSDKIVSLDTLLVLHKIDAYLL
jgi:hypothetical protein